MKLGPGILPTCSARAANWFISNSTVFVFRNNPQRRFLIHQKYTWSPQNKQGWLAIGEGTCITGTEITNLQYDISHDYVHVLSLKR